MKLRSALDKAKKYGNNDKHYSVPTSRNDRRECERIKWDPPIYDTSINACIDPEYLKEQRCVCIDPDSPETASYKILRTEIQHKVQLNNWKTILVTSALPDEGKTVTTLNLGLSFALAYNQTVLLVDCDLRSQGIHEYLGVDSLFGLVDNIVDEIPLHKVIVWPGIEKLSFISGGKRASNSAEILGSPQIKSLIEEMKSRYVDRIILLDCPPILSGADTVALAQLVDCIIIVVHNGRTRMRDVRKALDMMPEEKVIGFVMNKQRDLKRNGYYYY